MTILDADVVFSDYALAIQGLFFSLWLFKKSKNVEAFFFLTIACSSFFGGTYHGFFPEKTGTPLGKTFWIVTLSSIAMTANALWLLITPKALKTVIVSSVFFLMYVSFIDHRFIWAILYYSIPLVFFEASLVRSYLKSGTLRYCPSLVGIFGIALIACASVLQQLKIGVSATYFDHNALYHLLVFIGLCLVFGYFKSEDKVANGQ